MKKFSKIFCLVLAVALICTGLVLAVSADSAANEYTFDLAAAITAADAGSTVKLTGNAQPTSAITIDKNITIDLNGYTLSLPTNNAFSIQKTCTFTITGEGTIIADGTMIHVINNSAAKAPTVNIKGTGKGIKLDHTGAYYTPGKEQNVGLIIYSQQAGTFNLENLDIVSNVYVDCRSSSTGSENNQRGAMFRSDEGVAGTRWNFNRVSFYRDVDYDSEYNFVDAGAFVYIAGANAKATINDCVVRNSGPLVNIAYMQANTDPDHVFAEINNSHMEVIVRDGSRRINALTSIYRGSERPVVGTMNLNNSYFGGQVYRVIYGIKEGLKVNASNSVLANLGANDIDGTNDTDKLIMRAGQLTLTNGSVISTGNGGLVMNGKVSDVVQYGHLYAEVGTRFSMEALGSRSEIEWIDSEGNAVDRANVRIILDPIGNSHYPYVSTTDANAVSYNHLGAAKIDMFAMEYGSGTKTTVTKDGVTTVNRHGNIYGWLGEIDNQPLAGWTDFTSAFQGSAKNGVFTDVTYGGNTSFKYWVSPIDALKIGDARTLTADPYMIFGDVSGFSTDSFTAFAKIAETKVAVFDIDIATDSDYGFPKLNLQTNARTTTGSGKTGSSYVTLNSDGSFTNLNLTDFNSDIKLSLDGWNHLTVVVYTDNTNGNTEPTGIYGQTYVYVNGEFLGYYNGAYTDGATYIQGVRFNIEKTTQTVGQSILFDNFMRRAYGDYAVEGEADGAAKSPASYLITDIPANTNPVNNKIRVNGFDYADLDAAKAAANEYNETSETTGITETVELRGDLVLETLLDENIEIYHNGHTINIADASLGFVRDAEKYTFNEDYWYNAYWYNGELNNATQMADDANYVKTVVKLGFKLDHENLFTEATPDYALLKVVTQDGWAYTADAEAKVTALVPGLTELAAAKADASRATRFYPVITGVDMTYYVKNSSGTIYDGGVTDTAVASLKSLANGDTFVLRTDIALTESNLLFASTSDAPKVLSIDLAGHSLMRSVSGVMFQVGAYTTLNVYSSEVGGKVVATLANSSNVISDGGTCFVISDGTNNSAWVNSAQLVTTRGEVTEAYINVGKYGDIPGSNMTVIAERAYYGFKGGENCAITVDGVTTIAPGIASSCAVDAYVYDGEIYVRNGVLFVPTKNSVVNLSGFSTNCKNSQPRLAGFEDFIITSYAEFENMVIINNLSGLSDGSNNNIVSNNGDTSSLIENGTNHKALKFKNVITTGRLNPSNEASRTIIEGFVAAETHNHLAGQIAGTGNGIYNRGMTFDLISELGITDTVINFTIPAYSADAGELVTSGFYNVANNGVSIAGLENAYNLPILDQANAYEADLVNVNWKKADLSGNVTTETYVKGGVYKTITAPSGTVALNAVKLVGGAWNNIPAGGTVLNENVDVTCAYEVQPNVTGMKANLSLYSDFLVNLYIPEKYAQYITVNGDTLAGTVTIGEAKFLKALVAKNVKEASEDATFEIAITEGEYSATKTVSISITDYASQILAGGDKFADTDKVLMYYMLNYVNEAAKYFDGAEDAEAKALLDANTQWNVISVDKSFANAVAQTGLESIFASAGIVLNEAPAFTLTFGKAFTGKVTVTYGDGNVRVFENINAIEGDKLVVEDMKIYNFATNLTVTVEPTEGETVTGTINLDTYAKYHTENAKVAEGAEATADQQESIDALDLINALYDYVKVAEQYKGGTLTLPEAGNGSEETPAE